MTVRKYELTLIAATDRESNDKNGKADFFRLFEKEVDGFAGASSVFPIALSI
jgi:hypothetical protein